MRILDLLVSMEWNSENDSYLLENVKFKMRFIET